MPLSIPISATSQGKAAQAAAQEMKRKIKIEIEVDAEIVLAGGNRKKGWGHHIACLCNATDAAAT